MKQKRIVIRILFSVYGARTSGNRAYFSFFVGVSQPVGGVFGFMRPVKAGYCCLEFLIHYNLCLYRILGRCEK